ncbi:hypothetical protein ACIPSA_43425 [Streptomyces sp. NPDC086549]|uniref:hypothetical protein n=1 Tax=Streptomyces sp. NPDC086549 TaxID=3365752 RepID=UPI00380B3086
MRPGRKLGALRRRALRRLTVYRTRLMTSFFLPRRAGQTAWLRYAALLDGQTVNLHAELPASVTQADTAEIVLRRGLQRHRRPARVYPDPDGPWLMDAAVLLGAEAGGVPVGPGRWKLRLDVRSGGRSVRLPLSLAEPTTPRIGATGPMTRSPLTADRYRLGRTVRGDARVVCARARPEAEVAAVHIQHARIDVDLRVLGVRATAPWAEVLAAGRRVRCPLVEVQPGVWRLEVPLAEMVPTGGGREHWDVLVHPDRGAPLRLGRRLHDVRVPGRVFTMRKILVAPRRGILMRIEPRYTPAGSLRFTCSDGARAE